MKPIIVGLLALVMSACVTNPNTGEREFTGEGKLILEASIQVATVRLIGRSVTANDVVDAVAEIRTKINLDGELTADELMAAAEAVFNLDLLLPEERVLLTTILSYAEGRLESAPVGEVTARAGEILDWVAEAAILTQR